MPVPALTEEQRAELNQRIQKTKEICKDALRPYNQKFRSLILNAVLNDLDIEVPENYGRGFALRRD